MNGLATTAAFNTVKNEILNVSDLVKKEQNKMQKFQTLKKMYFTTCNYNKFKSKILDAKLKEKALVNKSDFLVFRDKETEALATKTELKEKQDEIMKLQTFN